MAEDYVTMCDGCNKPVTKENLNFVNGKVLCSECLKKQVSVQAPDPNLDRSARDLKVSLVQLKNLKSRNAGSKKRSSTSTKKKTTKKVKRKPAAKRRTVAKRKTKTRTQKRKPAAKRRTVAKRKTKTRRR